MFRQDKVKEINRCSNIVQINEMIHLQMVFLTIPHFIVNFFHFSFYFNLVSVQFHFLPNLQSSTQHTSGRLYKALNYQMQNTQSSQFEKTENELYFASAMPKKVTGPF